jgi:lipoyl(octanoyl) transferase
MVNDRQNLDLTPFAGPAAGEVVEWRISDTPVPYPEAVAAMEARAAAIAAHQAPELVWLLEHPALYTSGTSGKAEDLLDPRFPMFASGRGGQITYHGPGQRVAYVMLDLKRRRPDVRAYVAGLEEWIIRTLAAFNVRGERREDRVGVWVRRPDKGEGFEDKIAPYVFAGLPRLAKVRPCRSAAFRRIPARFIASVRSGPGFSLRASSSAICALASRSSWKCGSLFSGAMD